IPVLVGRKRDLSVRARVRCSSWQRRQQRYARTQGAKNEKPSPAQNETSPSSRTLHGQLPSPPEGAAAGGLPSNRRGPRSLMCPLSPDERCSGVSANPPLLSHDHGRIVRLEEVGEEERVFGSSDCVMQRPQYEHPFPRGRV